MDLSFVTERLAVGAGVCERSDVEQLVRLGVSHVFDCRASWKPDIGIYADTGIVVVRSGVEDDGEPKPTTWYEDGVRFALYALCEPRTKVYIHCTAGWRRSPSVVYAVLRAQGFPAFLARRMIKNAHPPAQTVYFESAERAVRELGYT